VRQKDEDLQNLVRVDEHTSLPPAVGCRPGGHFATTQDFLSTSTPQLQTSSSRGEGSAAADPNPPEDRAVRAGNGTQVSPRRDAHNLNNATTWGDDPEHNDQNPITGNRDDNTLPTRQTTQRQNGTKSKINITSLNIKGRMSGDFNKWMHLPQIIRENKLAILAIQETHLTDELVSQFETLFGNSLTLFHSPDPDTRNARGIAIIINKKLIKTDNVTETEIIPGRAIELAIPWHETEKIKILAIYAPNAPREIKDFWNKIQSKINDNTTLRPDIIMGDFNLVEDAIDRLLSKLDDPQAMESLRDIKLRYNLIDGWRKANPEEKAYTWSRTDGTQSRIDRIYINEEFFDDCSGWKISPSPIPSDHDLISASIATPSSPTVGRGRWAIPTRILKKKIIKDEIQKLGRELQHNLENIQTRTERVNPQTLLREFKTKARESLRKHEKIHQPQIKNRIRKLTENLRQTINDESLPADEIKITSIHIKKEIQMLLKETHQRNRETLSAIDTVEGEKIGKTWSNRHKENKPRDTIKCLRDPETDEVTRDSAKMTNITAKYHEKLQSDEHDPRAPPNRQHLEEILNQLETKLSNKSKAELANPITEDQVREAIKKTSNEKAPGLDGIPIELWKRMDDQYTESLKNEDPNERKCNITWILTQAFLDIEKHGMNEEAKLNEGCISPIYKKKDPDNVANYRPITLLNTDYKIFTKALSIKLADAVPEIINKDQAGFIKGRSIFDQVKTTKLVIEYMNRTNKKGTIVALDQEKAYDKILHEYLWEVLKKFEFPECFINTIKHLYDNAVTTVMINGELSETFQILRGVRQGDALSCLLFDIAIEPLAESIRKSQEIKGIKIPGKNAYLKIKLFADDTTVFLSENDSMTALQSILAKWCRVAGAKFNIEKTKIIPLGNQEQRQEMIESRKINDNDPTIPEHIRIAKEGEPVRILGAWLGNNVDEATTWAPILEDCCKRLKRWNAAKHSLEGRRLIVQMQVAGVTQYLTKVQGMPKNIETELDKQIRRFMWNNEKSDTVNRYQMSAPHKKGGKKMLDIETRNKAIHLTWLKAYLNLGEERATWTYFADAIIATDIPPSQKIDEDPESRIMPILQTWQTRARGSSLPDDLKIMLKLAKEYNVKLTNVEPSKQVKEELPIWYHTKSITSARKLYNTKTAKCLRKNHGIRLVRDVTKILGKINETHSQENNCNCDTCKDLRTTSKCPHPHYCIKLMSLLIEKILPEWNPNATNSTTNNEAQVRENEETANAIQTQPKTIIDNIKDAINIFEEKQQTTILPTQPTTDSEQNVNATTTVYTDGACINNGEETAKAGSGVWYGINDPRNISERVSHKIQSNQTGELTAVLLAIKNHPQNENLNILTDSKYVIEGLTKNAKKWEERNWTNIQHGDIFKCITAWTRWRKGKMYLKWVKGHSGIEGNEEADRLASEGANKEITTQTTDLTHPQGLTATGAMLSKLEQRDFYKIISERKAIPTRTRTERIIGMIQACTQETFETAPTTESIWEATKHKDFNRKTRDFIWKSTQHAYKIGEYWKNIEGYENREICPLCDEQEDMEHILISCKANARKIAWNLANEIWEKRHPIKIPMRLGDILGCGLASFKTDGKPDVGKNRLYRILVSETAYLIWRLRNERRIRENDDPDREHQENEITNRWTHAINKRLTIDRASTNIGRFGKRALSEKIVKRTWRNCLENEESLPSNWMNLKGVLVGIASTSPSGHVR